ncbi:MAG TPA: hypothetical protein VKB17_01715 [Thermoleophilaceae bacterium]|nr:hypothetical protein [Thermoleophilaceae bacterium]
MSVEAAGRGLVAAALARVEAFLLEPADPVRKDESPPSRLRRPVVAVFGLARRCGATTAARALAAKLAARDGGAAAVSSPVSAAGIPLASPAAARLARAMADVPHARTRAVGRLCLVEGPSPLELADAARLQAPLVLDAGSEQVGGAAAAVADHLVVVGAPALEPALAAVTSSCLARVGPPPLVVLNRADGDARWEGRAALELPESRVGAQLALGGREPRGVLGRAVSELADLCEEAR